MFLLVGCGTEQTRLPGESSTNATFNGNSEPTPSPTAVPTSTPGPTRTPAPEPTVTETPVPTPPGIVRDLELLNVTEDTITLQWKPPANSDVVSVERYEVIRDIPFGLDKHFFVSETTFIDVGLQSDIEHKYRVRAIGAEEIEGEEVSISGYTLAAPTPEPTPSINPAVVTAATWTDGDWPLTIDGGVLTCTFVPVPGRPAAVFITDSDGEMWPLNGVAREHHAHFGAQPELEPIWRLNREIMDVFPDSPPVRISITSLIKRGLELCE